MSTLWVALVKIKSNPKQVGLSNEGGFSPKQRNRTLGALVSDLCQQHRKRFLQAMQIHTKPNNNSIGVQDARPTFTLMVWG